MTRDTERIFRWLTQAELEADLAAAHLAGFAQGAIAMREAAAALVADSNPRVPLGFVAHDVRKLELAPVRPAVVEWERKRGSRSHGQQWDDGTYFLTVHKHRSKGKPGPWNWYVEDRRRELGSGYVDTIEAAKAEAMKVADAHRAAAFAGPAKGER